MTDYISREAALNAVHNVPKGNWSNARYTHELQAIPAADVAPVVHGRWQGVSPMVDSMECSVCRYCIPSEEFETPFCPWCGAKMDGGKQSE